MMGEQTERPFTQSELDEVMGILRNQDSILGLRLRLVNRLQATLDAARAREDAWPRAIAWVRGHYAEDVFPPESTTPDAKAARMGRLTCDNILRRHAEELAASEPPKAGGVT